jgi:hypothetical protein
VNTISEWLTNLEARGDTVKANAAELWPRTPYLNIQAEIWRRVGASDYNWGDPRSRAGNIVNTFRGWEKADLPAADMELAGLMLAWMARNAHYAFVTATDAQIVMLRECGWWTFDIGPGEDDTRLIGMFLGRST